MELKMQVDIGDPKWEQAEAHAEVSHIQAGHEFALCYLAAGYKWNGSRLFNFRSWPEFERKLAEVAGNPPSRPTLEEVLDVARQHFQAVRRAVAEQRWGDDAKIRERTQQKFTLLGLGDVIDFSQQES